MKEPGRPIRSLFVTHSPRWNGETEYAFGAIRTEIAMGWEVTVLAPRDCPLVRKVAGSVRLEEYSSPRPSSSPVSFLRDLGRLSRLIGEGGFDVIHSSRATGHLLAALAARRRVPLYHLRGGAKKPYRHPGNILLYRYLTSGVIVSSRRLEERLTGCLKMPPERVHRILAPVDTESFRPAAPDPSLWDELGIPRTVPLVVKVARLAPIKGHPVLLEAMARVRKKLPPAVLVLVGPPIGVQGRLVRRRIGELGLEGSVVLTGRRTDIPRLLRSAAVCVSSSLGSEENSRAVGEYMASGRPVAATRVGVIPEMVEEGVTGRLVPPGDSEALAGAIADILENPERAEEMGAAGRRRAEKEFSQAVFAGRLRRVLGV